LLLEVAMTERIARWLEEHSNFARLLDVLEGELEAFHWGAKPNYRLMLDVMSYMTQYPDRFHHPSEELAFRKGVERNPRLKGAVASLGEEHTKLLQRGESLVLRLEAVLNEAILPRADVEASGLEYIRCLRRHMRREELEVFPAIGRLLTAADWMEIDRAIACRPDPVFGPKALAKFRTLRRQIWAEVSR
jgi:hemerythrin-like domain-containing protein